MSDCLIRRRSKMGGGVVVSVETFDSVDRRAIEYVHSVLLTPHQGAQNIPISKDDEKTLRAGIARDGVKTPLHVTPNWNILDGVHRWRFAKELGITSLPVIIFSYKEPEEEFLHAIKSNLERRHLNEGQRAGLALRILPLEETLAKKRMSEDGQRGALNLVGVRERGKDGTFLSVETPGVVSIDTTPGETGGRSKQTKEAKPNEKREAKAATKAAKSVGVSPETVYKAKKVQEKSPVLFDSMLKGEVSVTKAYQQVKAEERVQEVTEASESGRHLTDLEIMDKLKIPIQPYDVWNFASCDDRFGHDYPGRVPGQLVAHCLYYWTEQGDTVLDPMAGSGTTIDVCKVLNRHVLAYDAHPCREDIVLHDLAHHGWPEETPKAKLIFWDPPYFKKKDSGYGEQSISRFSRSEYLAFFFQAFRAIPDDFQGRLAFLMSDYTEGENAEESIWFTDYITILAECGWHAERYIQTPLSTQSIHPDIVKKFRESKRMARLGRVLVVVTR